MLLKDFALCVVTNDPRGDKATQIKALRSELSHVRRFGRKVSLVSK